MVSLIVVSYNHARFIPTCLDSIKNQTHRDWELIVADDASSDNSIAIYESWLESNNVPAKKNYHTVNTGLATTLNECLELCSGEYIKIIAADDFLHPEYLEKTLSYFSKNIGLVYTDTFIVDEDNQINGEDYYKNLSEGKSSDELKISLKKHNIIPALSAIMSKEAVTATGPYVVGKIMEDYDRWLKIIANFDIAFFPEKLCYYRVHSHNITKTNSLQLTQEDLELKILHDEDGENQDHINREVERLFYRFPNQMNNDFIKVYSNYKFNKPHLAKALYNRQPLLLYKINKKINLWLRR